MQNKPISISLTDQQAALIVQSLSSTLARDPTGLAPITTLLKTVQTALDAREESLKKEAAVQKAIQDDA